MISMLSFLPLVRRHRRADSAILRRDGASSPKGKTMVKLALFVRLEAKPGKEAAVADFLAGALPLANAESGTTCWFALKFGPSTFGVFDAFADETARQAHLQGPIAAALMANAAALLSVPPTIEKVDLLAAKLPG
jgi:quinol monooxygenase YgiN